MVIFHMHHNLCIAKNSTKPLPVPLCTMQHFYLPKIKIEKYMANLTLKMKNLTTMKSNETFFLTVQTIEKQITKTFSVEKS